MEGAEAGYAFSIPPSVVRSPQKQKLVRRLISDRGELLDAQQQASMKVMAVHERLTRIETQLQQQNQAYELRIEELNRELLATKQENRALIHAKIVQVKAEMEPPSPTIRLASDAARPMLDRAMNDQRLSMPAFQSLRFGRSRAA